MNRFATSILALALAGAGSTALAEQTKDQISTQTAKPQPVQMTDAQMDNVAAGLVVVNDVIDINNNDVEIAVPVAAFVALQANAALAVLGSATSVAGQNFRPGRVNQPVNQ